MKAQCRPNICKLAVYANWQDKGKLNFLPHISQLPSHYLLCFGPQSLVLVYTVRTQQLGNGTGLQVDSLQIFPLRTDQIWTLLLPVFVSTGLNDITNEQLSPSNSSKQRKAASAAQSSLREEKDSVADEDYLPQNTPGGSDFFAYRSSRKPNNFQPIVHLFVTLVTKCFQEEHNMKIRYNITQQ